ncbi:MAG: hypothetical protein M1822_009850 [Bathelium mastoideum]|nr:MAG: hypothetical protein M1822_009850 [Bathelium mastoideum]
MVWTPSLNPLRSFPTYSGPYSVGSVDAEFPVSELESTHSGPDPDIATVAFRVFYPCETDTKRRKPVRWLPDPQRPFFSAYARFLGAGAALADAISYMTPHLYYITIPVQRNAPVLKPNTTSGRWPVVVFSHGLGGSRNAYSHLLGSLASHGMVVIATEHRDGSAPISFIHATNTTGPKTARYRRVSHTPSPDVYASRDEQLRIRLWEVSLVHAALLKIDSGEKLTALGCKETSSTPKVLSEMAHLLDVQRPGRITWAGHSFGAATTIQFVKSIYWRCPDPSAEGYTPLFVPLLDSALIEQITPDSPIVVLDLWAMPLKSPSTTWLQAKPMPSYDNTLPPAPGGDRLLAILSEAFFKWRGNLNDMRRALAPPDSQQENSAAGFPDPQFFYPLHSAHLSQSDFGILFPWFTRRIFGAMEPERVVRLNTRAILQMLRQSRIDVAETKRIDAEEEQEREQSVGSDGKVDDDETIAGRMETRNGDWKILAADGGIRGWIRVGSKEEVVSEDDSDQSTIDVGNQEESGTNLQKSLVEGEVLTELTKGEPVLN